jgi:cytochrome c-type biogenesis protein CcmF
MIPELGHYALVLALCLALVQTIFPLAGTHFHKQTWIALARPMAYGQCLLISLSFFALAYAFLANDFSVTYVANNSNSQLPAIYRFCAVWGAHEGSLLLWVLELSIWTAAVAFFSRQLPHEIVARVLSVLGFISVGFLLFLLITSNPFLRLLPNSPPDGLDLNPLLQDPGLIIHPPMLYMGYVGFSVAFAFAITALISGKLDATWARWSKPWTLIAWCFLTFGILLGSWWAYRQLGWGGWWFWDPVENASFLPWLAGTALIHSLSVTEKQNSFKAWTVLLAIVAFLLSLLGTFLVRSGVLISVHAFAVDPSRGIFMLLFLATVIALSLGLYAWRIQRIRTTPSPFSLLSRQSFLLANNMLLTGSMLTILLGTLYPLFIDALGLEKISVGPPYFNIVFVPFMACVLFLMGIAPFSRWQHTENSVLKKLWLTLVLAFLLAFVSLWVTEHAIHWGVVLGLGLACWIILATLQSLLEKTTHFWTLRQLTRAQWGMVVAHIGMAVCTIGVVLVSHYSIQKEVRVLPGDRIDVGVYSFEFMGARDLKGPNYTGAEGGVMVREHNKLVAFLTPEERVYNVQKMALAKTAIDATVFRDLYVALGEKLDGQAWSLRVYYKPFVRWIWFGGLMMILGGMLAFCYRRFGENRKTD